MSRRSNRIALAAASASLLYASLAGAEITTNVGAPKAIAAQTTDIILQNQATTSNAEFTVAGAGGIAAGSTITLQVNGAVFATVPTVVVHNAAGAAAGLGALGGGTLISDTQAQWTVTTLVPTDEIISFGLATSQPATDPQGGDPSLNTDLRGVTAGTDVNYTITINQAGAAIEGTPVDTDVAFSIVDAAVLTTVTPNTDTADVSQSFIFLTTSTGETTGGTATFTIDNPTSAQNLDQGNLVCILRGDFTGIASVSGTSITGSSDSGSTAGGAPNQFLIDSSNEFAAAVITTPGLTTAATPNIAPVFELDGVTAQDARSFTMECDLLAGGTFTGQDNIISPVATENIARNGFGFQSVFLGTSANNQVVIRDHSGNLGTAGGNISVTLTYYDGNGAGTTVGPATLTTTLPNNGQVVMTPAEIIAEMGAAASGVPTDSFATFEFAVETAAGSAGNKKQVPGIGIDIQEATNIGTGLL